MPVFPFCELSQAQKSGLKNRNGLRIDVRECNPPASVPWGGVLHNLWREKPPMQSRGERRKQGGGWAEEWDTSLSVTLQTLSVLQTPRCDLFSGVSGQEFSCPWEKTKHACLRLHCNTSENDLYLCSVCFEAGKLLGWKSDPDKTPVLRYLPVVV